MNVSLYQAAAAMNANDRWQEMISQNLSSGSNPGYRKQDVSFTQVQAGLNAGSGSISISRSGHSIPVATASTNFTQGTLRTTGSNMDFAVEGSGFFEVQLPNGDHAFTRDGEFSLNAQGQVVTKQGYTVLSDSGPIQMDPANSSPLNIAPTGEISQGADTKGKLKIVEFAQPNQLTSIGQGCFLANGQPAQDSTTSLVRQGFLEGANTSPTAEMVSLITAMRMFEANNRSLSMQDERMGKVISDLGNAS